MKRMNIMVDMEKWEQARKKAGGFSMSAIVRKLIEMWLAGKIEIKFE